MRSDEHKAAARRASVARELNAAEVDVDEPGLAEKVAAYVDVLDAAMADGFLATFERNQLATAAAELGLEADRLRHIHEGYFIALAVLAWADGEITWNEEAQMTMAAVALSIPTDEAIELVLTARDIETPVELLGLSLTPRDRISFVEPLGTLGDVWRARAEGVGLAIATSPAAARYVVTANPNAAELAELWSDGAMIVTEWAFDAAIEQMEERRRRRGLIM